jgi:hypothetical protein
MHSRRHLTLHLLAIIGLAAAAAYMHHGITSIAQVFIEIREADARYFRQLIRDNWDGIATIPSEKKQVVISNLDPELAGSDVRAMRDLMLALMYAFMVALVVQTAVSAVKIWRRRNESDAL